MKVIASINQHQWPIKRKIVHRKWAFAFAERWLKMRPERNSLGIELNNAVQASLSIKKSLYSSASIQK